MSPGPPAPGDTHHTHQRIIPPEVWEALSDRLEDMDLAAIANERLNDGEQPVKVSLDER